MNRSQRYIWYFRIYFNDLISELSWQTRGRFFFTRYFSEIVGSHKWCFIVGCNNSGTSLLQKLFELTGKVSTHSTEGQLYTRTLTRSIRRRYAYLWSEYIDELIADEKLSPISVGPRLAHDWMRELNTPIKNIIVEKTPANVTRMKLLQQIFPNSYFIGLVRNGYSVSEGIKRKGRHSISKGAKHWNTVNQLLVKNSDTVDRFLLVKYEDLADRPAELVNSIAEFLEMDSTFFSKAIEAEFTFQTILGSSSRPITNLNSQSIQRLSPADIKTITLHAKPMLDLFNYTQEE